MLIFALLLLMSWDGVLGVSLYFPLEYQAHKTCQSETLGDGLPENEEEAFKTCEKFREINQCVTNYLETQDIETPDIETPDIETPHSIDIEFSDEDLWYLHKNFMMIYLRRLCSLNPDTFPKYFSTEDCSRNVSITKDMEELCLNTEQKVMPALQKRKERMLMNENETVRNLYDKCLSLLFDINCVLDLHYNKCGSDARDVVFQLNKTNWDKICPLDIRIDVLELLDSLTLLTEKEFFAKNFLITKTLL